MPEEKYPHKILIIEDEKAMRDALVDNLHAAGFGHISEVADGEAGLMLARAEHPDVILLDIVLPRMDGMAMLKKLREDSDGKNIKVILLTNLTADDAIVNSVAKSEPSYYLLKVNYSIDDVVSKVKEVLGIRPI